MVLSASRDNTLSIVDGFSLVADTPPQLYNADGFRIPYLWSRARFRYTLTHTPSIVYVLPLAALQRCTALHPVFELATSLHALRTVQTL